MHSHAHRPGQTIQKERETFKTDIFVYYIRYVSKIFLCLLQTLYICTMYITIKKNRNHNNILNTLPLHRTDNNLFEKEMLSHTTLFHIYNF